jgi:hypothetical protein
MPTAEASGSGSNGGVETSQRATPLRFRLTGSSSSAASLPAALPINLGRSSHGSSATGHATGRSAETASPDSTTSRPGVQQRVGFRS